MPKLTIDEPFHLGERKTLTPEEAAQNTLYYDESNGFRQSKQYLTELKESRPYTLVRKFHTAFGHPVAESPQEMGKERRDKRFTWMLEELDEFKHADHIVDQVDALIDILYLTYGTLVELGVEPTAHFQHVHDANMRKLSIHGKPLYKEDGKVAKPEGWRGPELDITRTLVLSSVEEFRENPMFAALDLKGVKELKRKYELLQSRYGDQLVEEYREKERVENVRRFEERLPSHNPFTRADAAMKNEEKGEHPRLT